MRHFLSLLLIPTNQLWQFVLCINRLSWNLIHSLYGSSKTWSREECSYQENKSPRFPATESAVDWPQLLHSKILHHVSTQVTLAMVHSQPVSRGIKCGIDTKLSSYLGDGTFCWWTFFWFGWRTPQQPCWTPLGLYWSTQPLPGIRLCIMVWMALSASSYPGPLSIFFYRCFP